MENPHTADTRLTELEIKASYAEDLLDRLNQVIVQQQEDIRLLAREIALLKHQVLEHGADLPTGARDELPPHY